MKPLLRLRYPAGVLAAIFAQVHLRQMNMPAKQMVDQVNHKGSVFTVAAMRTGDGVQVLYEPSQRRKQELEKDLQILNDEYAQLGPQASARPSASLSPEELGRFNEHHENVKARRAEIRRRVKTIGEQLEEFRGPITREHKFDELLAVDVWEAGEFDLLGDEDSEQLSAAQVLAERVQELEQELERARSSETEATASDEPESNLLVAHARRELQLAGMFDEDADYGPKLGEHILSLVKEFSKGGHSGGSAQGAIGALFQLLQFKNLTALTSNPEEWMDRSEETGSPMWQNKRRPTTFSTDGGATWYDLDEVDSTSGPDVATVEVAKSGEAVTVNWAALATSTADEISEFATMMFGIDLTALDPADSDDRQVMVDELRAKLKEKAEGTALDAASPVPLTLPSPTEGEGSAAPPETATPENPHPALSPGERVPGNDPIDWDALGGKTAAEIKAFGVESGLYDFGNRNIGKDRMIRILKDQEAKKP